jgi:hypothetical protein
MVILLLVFEDFFETTWNGGLFYSVQALIILLNVMGNLASMAMKICVERDWVSYQNSNYNFFHNYNNSQNEDKVLVYNLFNSTFRRLSRK